MKKTHGHVEEEMKYGRKYSTQVSSTNAYLLYRKKKTSFHPPPQFHPLKNYWFVLPYFVFHKYETEERLKKTKQNNIGGEKERKKKRNVKSD